MNGDIKTIKLNVGGQIFESTEDIWFKCEYLHALINYNSEKIEKNIPIFVNRSPKIFAHIHALLIDENYNFPEKYKSEFDFYMIEYYTSFNNPKVNLTDNYVSVSGSCFTNCEILARKYCGDDDYYLQNMYNINEIYEKPNLFQIVAFDSKHNEYLDYHNPENDGANYFNIGRIDMEYKLINLYRGGMSNIYFTGQCNISCSSNKFTRPSSLCANTYYAKNFCAPTEKKVECLFYLQSNTELFVKLGDNEYCILNLSCDGDN